MQDGPLKGPSETPPRWGGFDKFQKYKNTKSKSCDYAELDYIDENTENGFSTNNLVDRCQLPLPNGLTGVRTTRQVVSVRVTGRREVRTTVTTRVMRTTEVRGNISDRTNCAGIDSCDNTVNDQNAAHVQDGVAAQNGAALQNGGPLPNGDPLSTVTIRSNKNPKVRTDLKLNDASLMNKFDFKSSASPTMVVNAGWFSSLKRTKKNRNKNSEMDNVKATSKSAWDLSSMKNMVLGKILVNF